MGRYFIRRVVGESMSPTMHAGDVVIVKRTHRVESGDVAVFLRHNRELIKRIQHEQEGGYFVLGDNPDQSTDSRHFGRVSKADILGVIIMKVQFAHATNPPRAARASLTWIPYLTAAIWIVVLLLYLYFFEQSVRLSMVMFDALASRSGIGFLSLDFIAKLFTAVFSLSILFGLPFLLQMRLSPLARIGSVLSLMLASVIYVGVAVLFSVGRSVLTLDVLLASLLFVMSMLSLPILNARDVFGAGKK